MKLRCIAVLALLLSFCSAACARVKKPFVGVVSYYARKHQGRITASGERYDGNKLTAASRTLPFGTHLWVTCLKTKKSVRVTVNDRGPFRKGRVLDVSRSAAARLGMIGMGVCRAEIQPE